MSINIDKMKIKKRVAEDVNLYIEFICTQYAINNPSSVSYDELHSYVVEEVLRKKIQKEVVSALN